MTIFLTVISMGFFNIQLLNYVTTMVFIGGCFGSGAFFLITVIKAEIFPTTLRQLGMGSCSVAMRVGSTIAPYTRELVTNRIK